MRFSRTLISQIKFRWLVFALKIMEKYSDKIKDIMISSFYTNNKLCCVLLSCKYDLNLGFHAKESSNRSPDWNQLTNALDTTIHS